MELGRIRCQQVSCPEGHKSQAARVSFGPDIHLSSNAVNQALGRSKAVVKDSAEAGGFDHPCTV